MDVASKNKEAKASENGEMNGDSLLSRAKAILDIESAAILDAADRLGDAFVGSVEAILACSQRVCVTGVGKAGLIGNKIQATLASTGTPAYSLHPVEALHGDLGMVEPGDVVIALSKSGSSELVELLPRLRELDCRVILLTARPESKAAACADFVLHIGETEEACPLGLAPSSSTAAMLAIGDALALTVMELRDVKAEQYARYHPGGALGRMLTKAHEVMRTGDDCPSVLDTASVGDCAEMIEKAPRRAGAAAVVDRAGKLVGILTLGDFFRLSRGGEGFADRVVSSVMTKDPKRVGLDERMTEGVRLIREYAIDELPVVDDEGVLVGMIDVQDLIARGYTVFDTQ